MSTTDNFWQAILNHNWSAEPVKVEFRLYYDEEGNVLSYSMEDVPGTYIVIDRGTFEACRFDVKVRNGKIIKVNQPKSWKLVPAEEGAYACHQDNINIIVSNSSANKKYWKVETTHDAD